MQGVVISIHMMLFRFKAGVLIHSTPALLYAQSAEWSALASSSDPSGLLRLCRIEAARPGPRFVPWFAIARKYDGQIDFRGGVNRGIKADSFFYYYLAIKENTI